MNSKWQINRVGLVDFWYYDEEEFEFLDGRMLLRGANGSGKSVTMQSFIPLLLDGNMRPERLDPFGSRARKMENYLLEEGDEREERTAYLYLEVKRLESDEYLTIGIGMRARRNKKLESWYFCITDGRRIGKDLFLYKDVQNKITCSKLELRNRIGEGGKIMETQSEYAHCVNRLLFGFETQEEYKELLDLLIQLRTPKLSKDFKPTVINDILSSSLQTLSEDDLRPMSEAIENMDSLKTNLDSLQESVRAAKQIEKVYDQYNQIVLYDKALLFCDAGKSYKDCEKKAKEFDRLIAECGKERTEEETRYQGLKREEAVLKEEKDSLDKSDAAKLKEQEVKVKSELAERRKEQEEKEKQEQEKREKEIETEQKIKAQMEKNGGIWSSIEDALEEMESELEGIPFDEFTFLKEELSRETEEIYSFQSHNQLLSDYMQKVTAGKNALLEEKSCQEKYDRYLQELDECHEERNRAEKAVTQYDNLLHEVKSELTEEAYRWEKSNQELHLKQETMQNISRKIEEYEMGKDYSEIKDLAKSELDERQGDFLKEKIGFEKLLKDARIKKEEAEEELEAWMNQKDPEPEQLDWVKANRKILREKGIPYLQFYKTVDFGKNLTEMQMDNLEEALLETGILDALIIPAEYREQVFSLDPGVCDKYIFDDIVHVKQNMTELLEIDNAENDILLYQNISHILSSIGFGEKTAREFGTTAIDLAGNYRIGILEGSITRKYKAKFIGVRARETYRNEKIKEYRALCEALAEEVSGLERQLEENHKRTENLQNEWNNFPKDTDLRTAAKELHTKIYELELKEKKYSEQKERVEDERKLLDEIRQKVREACAKCYMAARLDVFTDALDSLQNYKMILTELQIAYGNYQNGIQTLNYQKDYMEGIEADLDNIRYELAKTARRVKDIEAEFHSIQKQLELTDYAEIKERLDYCIMRLAALPQEREDSVKKIEGFRKEEESLIEKREKNEILRTELAEKKSWMKQVFEAEYKLGYVERSFVITEDMEDQAEKVCRMLAGSFGNKKQSDLFGSLQEVFHQNRGYLLEYQISLQYLFEEMDGENGIFELSVKRLDFTAKYRGAAVKFKDLIEKMSEDAEERARLLSDKDRELFEDILANTISKKIRGKIQSSKRWVEKMNDLMESMQTSSGLTLSLRWKNRRAEKEEQLDTRVLVELLQKDVEIMRKEEVELLSRHFRSKIEEARKLSDDVGSVQSFHSTMREVLDYRRWFEFQLECQKTGEKKKELTDRVFFTFSGGEKAMAMYVPLFSAVVAKYAGARQDAPKMISLDEAFAGVDEMNIRDMFRLMVEFEFNFMINSQILWGDHDTVPGLAIYQLIRPENAKYVSVIRYIWNGKMRKIV